MNEGHRAYIIEKPGIRVLREAWSGGYDILDGWRSLLERDAPGSIVDAGFDVDLSGLREVEQPAPTNDAAAASFIYAALHPRFVKHLGHNFGLWSWLAIAHPDARRYMLLRWPNKDRLPHRFLDARKTQHGLYRLWYAAHIVSSATVSDGDPGWLLDCFFQNQTTSQFLLEVQALRDPDFFIRYLSLSSKRHLGDNEAGALLPILRKTSGTRCLRFVTDEEMLNMLDHEKAKG